MKFNFKTAATAAIASGVLAGALVASAQTSTSTGGYCFTKNMRLGTSGSEVKMLQQTLNAQGFTVSATGVGSMGMETTYFGAKTKAAVMKFQAANADMISAATGNAYGQTRAVLNQGCAGSTTTSGTTVPAVSGSVTVALGASQPNNVLAAGSSRALLANLVFSGNGSVTSVKLMRTGVSNNTTLTNVYLYDTNTWARLTDTASVLTDGTVTFNNTMGIFNVSGSRNISVLADIACSTVGTSATICNTSGQSVGVSVSGYTAAGNPMAVVSGVSGPMLPVGSVDLATAFFSTPTPSMATTLNAGVMGTTIWSSTLSVGTRSVNFKNATFKFIGSAPTDSLANIKLFVDGIQWGNAVSISSNGYIALTGNPKLLTTGNHTFDVRADIVKGSGRNFYLSIENAGDVTLEDSNLISANLSAKLGSTTGSTISNLSAATISINSGTLTIVQNSAFIENTAVGGTTNQILGSYKFYAYGEDVKVSSLSATINQTTALTPVSTALNNVTVYVNGGAITSGVVTTLGAASTFNLGSNLIVPAGGSSIVEIRGDLVNSSNQNATSGVLQTTLNAVSNGAQGMYSFNLTNVPVATGQSLTVNQGNVSFGKTAGIGDSNISKNQSGIKIGSFILQAGSSETINVTNIAVNLGGTAVAGTSYTNLKITDGTQTIVPTAINNFSVNYDLAAGQTKTIEVWADTLEATTGLTIIPTVTVTYRGKTSNTTNMTAATVGQISTIAVVTVATPTVVGASTLGSRYVIGGNTLSGVVTYNVTATNGSAVINDLTFTATTTGPAAIESLTIGNSTAPNASGMIMFTGLNLSVPSGTSGLNISVAAKYVSITAVGQGGAASGVYDTVALTGMKFTAGGSVTSTTTLSVPGNAMTVVATLPTVKRTLAGAYLGTGATTGAKVGTFTVSADAKGDIIISNVPVNVSLPTGGTATVFTVKANGTNLVGTTGYVAPTTVTSGFNFGTTGYRISAGSLVTFDVYADVSGVTTAGNSDISLGSAASFSWSDVVNATAITTTGPLTGAILQTYNQ